MNTFGQCVKYSCIEGNRIIALFLKAVVTCRISGLCTGGIVGFYRERHIIRVSVKIVVAQPPDKRPCTTDTSLVLTVYPEMLTCGVGYRLKAGNLGEGVASIPECRLLFAAVRIFLEVFHAEHKTLIF